MKYLGRGTRYKEGEGWCRMLMSSNFEGSFRAKVAASSWLVQSQWGHSMDEVKVTPATQTKQWKPCRWDLSPKVERAR